MLLRPKLEPNGQEICSSTKIELPNKKKWSSCLGCYLLADVPFFMYCMATSLFNLGYSAFLMHIVNKAVFNGIDKQKAALLPSVVGISNITGRLLFGLVTIKFRMNKVVMYGLPLPFIGTMILLMNIFDSLAGLVCCSALASLGICEYTQKKNQHRLFNKTLN